MSDKISAHIIHEERGVLAKPLLNQVPRKGDEIRLSGERYFEVTIVVWALDEQGPYQRVNIGVKDAAEVREK